MPPVSTVVDPGDFVSTVELRVIQNSQENVYASYRLISGNQELLKQDIGQI
jgi:hypothetical protein